MIPAVDLAALFADPHAEFRALRRDHPVVMVQPGLYLVLRHADVLAATQDPRLHQMNGADYVAIAGIPKGPVAEFLSRIMVFDATAGHAVKRRPFNVALSFPKVNAMRARIREIAMAHVARLPEGEPFDLVDRLAARLPAAVICGVLGLDEAAAERIFGEVETLSLALGATYPMERHGEIEAAVATLAGFVRAEIEARRRAGRDDLLTVLATARGDLRLEDLVMQVVGMLMAGSDTTRGAIAVAAARLLPGWAAHEADPEPAIWEALRLDSPVGTLPLWTDDDWPVPGGGGHVPGGSMVGLSTLSAMRDPAAFAEPDRFVPDRAEPRDLVFGTGAHRCMGTRIAMIEIAETLACLAARFGRIEFAGEARLEGFGGVRKIRPLPVTCHAEAA